MWHNVLNFRLDDSTDTMITHYREYLLLDIEPYARIKSVSNSVNESEEEDDDGYVTFILLSNGWRAFSLEHYMEMTKLCRSSHLLVYPLNSISFNFVRRCWRDAFADVEKRCVNI